MALGSRGLLSSNILDVCQCRAEGNGPGEQRYWTGDMVIYMMIYMVIWIICILCVFISWQAAPEERHRIRSILVFPAAHAR